jgi:hypothetical protein
MFTSAPRWGGRRTCPSLDEVLDPVGLVLDELAELAVALVRALLEKLRGAADAGQRVLHLMRQHRAIAEAPRAAPRKFSCRSSICAVEASCSVSTTPPDAARAAGRPARRRRSAAAAGLSRIRVEVIDRRLMVADTAPAGPNSRLSGGQKLAQADIAVSEPAE